jgi:hypothetical protein
MSQALLEAGASPEWQDEIGKYVFKHRLLCHAGLTIVKHPHGDND